MSNLTMVHSFGAAKEVNVVKPKVRISLLQLLVLGMTLQH
jgi:hypothetical protein